MVIPENNPGPAPAAPAPGAGETSPPASPTAPPCFPRLPGETPRAYSAFIAFYQLGHARSLPAVADKLGESLGTVKNWSSKFEWNNRVQAFNAGLLQQQAEAHATHLTRHAADWAQRLEQLREQEWETAQKLRIAARCFLESFGEEELRRMNLAQVSRALSIASRLGRSALAGADLPPAAEPALSPVQQLLLETLKRAYPQSGPGPQSSQS